ncbi:hypothetical protein ScPMuIL_016013 [Solemya velum]
MISKTIKTRITLKEIFRQHVDTAPSEEIWERVDRLLSLIERRVTFWKGEGADSQSVMLFIDGMGGGNAICNTQYRFSSRMYPVVQAI